MMSWAELVRLATLAVPDGFDLPLYPNYNVAPTQEVVIVRKSGAGAGAEPAVARWGLVPFWAESEAVGSKMINARAETLASKPAFRNAFQTRRCLVPANGFYEWRKPASGAGKKQPMYIRLKSSEPFAFAGLWERWDKGPAPLETFTIVTCPPNELMAQIHNRMPVILPADRCGTWLAGNDTQFLESMLVPFPADQMAAYPVSSRINNPRLNDPACMEPLVEPPQPPPPTLVQSQFGW